MLISIAFWDFSMRRKKISKLTISLLFHMLAQQKQNSKKKTLGKE